MIFSRNALYFKVILAFCLIHVFAIEHTLQIIQSELENLGGKLYQLKKHFAGRDEIRTDTV